MEKIEKILAWIERMLMPKLNEITGEIKDIHTRIAAQSSPLRANLQFVNRYLYDSHQLLQGDS
ncbi:hypothetical protein C5S32_05040 [ANME-1 cluster archaeon GoMg1]|nr:hypothetical protein [ANME-1 cluster archaeon GoMg1]